jgi:hypothetical protein
LLNKIGFQKNIIQQTTPLKKHVTCHFDHRHNILKKCKNFEKIILSEAACQEKLVTDSLEYLRILNSLNGTFIFVHT